MILPHFSFALPEFGRFGRSVGTRMHLRFCRCYSNSKGHRPRLAGIGLGRSGSAGSWIENGGSG
eukprot:5891446-Alexandrium_andersonii.AAC.1